MIQVAIQKIEPATEFWQRRTTTEPIDEQNNLGKSLFFGHGRRLKSLQIIYSIITK